MRPNCFSRILTEINTNYGFCIYRRILKLHASTKSHGLNYFWKFAVD